jgi:uncharacterized protein with PIN domain
MMNLDSRVHEMLKARAKRAAEVLTTFEAACPSCRALNSGFVKATVGHANPFDHGMRKDGSCAVCPKCNRVVWSDES